MSDQIHDDIKLRIHNANFLLAKSDDNSLYQKKGDMYSESLVQVDMESELEQELMEQFGRADYTPEYQINGLKARSSMIVDIPIFLRDPENLNGFYDHFNGALETTVSYAEFATSTDTKHKVLVFNEIK